MKKIVYVLSVMFAFSSCTPGKSGDENQNTNPNSLSEEIPLSKLDMVDELAGLDNHYEILFNASGTEPGWMADFSKDKIRIIVEAGRDSVIMDRNNNDLDAKSDLTIKLPSGSSDVMIIENKSCTAISGDVQERTVSLKCKGKEYKGCGSFKK